MYLFLFHFIRLLYGPTNCKHVFIHIDMKVFFFIQTRDFTRSNHFMFSLKYINTRGCKSQTRADFRKTFVKNFFQIPSP